jgi:DnaJ-class molecular chaperone
MVNDTTLYDRLGVDSSADETQIKKAFTKLSVKWHPDKNLDNQEEAHQKFQELTQAKEILLDQEKRRIYDQVGMNIFNEGSGQDNPFGGHDFSHFFNFPFGNQERQEQQLEELKEVLNCKLEDIYNEKIIKHNYKYKLTCSTCNGSGVKHNSNPKCSECDGKGMRVQVVRIGPMIQQMVNTCEYCNGSGKNINNENKCNTCNGTTFIYKEKSIDIPLKSGLVSSNKIVLSGKGHNVNNKKSDLVLIINVLPHNIFKRSNKENSNDLFITIEITLYQALFGFDKMITHMDGRNVYLSSKTKTEYGAIKKIPCEGMKTINNSKGNLYVKLIFNLPDIMFVSHELKSQLKIVLQDNTENITNNNSINLVDCNLNETDKLTTLFSNINLEETETPKKQQQRQQQHQQQQQCVQQ